MAVQHREPLNISREDSPLTVWSPMAQAWLPAWVENGRIVCLTCAVTKGLRVNTDPEKYVKLDDVRRQRLNMLVIRHERG